MRIEIGPKDIEKNQAVLVRRDTREKIVVSLDEITEKTAELLETIQNDMFNAALAHREEHTYEASDYETFTQTVEEKPGFVKAPWCGCRECEDKIKEDTGATTRCIPFAGGEALEGATCVCCGKPAKHVVYFGRAY